MLAMAELELRGGETLPLTPSTCRSYVHTRTILLRYASDNALIPATYSGDQCTSRAASAVGPMGQGCEKGGDSVVVRESVAVERGLVTVAVLLAAGIRADARAAGAA